MSEHLIDGEKPSKKKERFEFMQQIWLRPTPHDLDIVDAGDHVNIVACTADVVGWWISKLRTMYPQDIMGEKGHCFTLNPETGVTLKIGKEDGSVKVKGKRHQEWLRENFDTLFGLAEEVQQVGQTEMARQCDYFLNLSDSHMVSLWSTSSVSSLARKVRKPFKLSKLHRSQNVSPICVTLGMSDAFVTYVRVRHKNP